MYFIRTPDRITWICTASAQSAAESFATLTAEGRCPVVTDIGGHRLCLSGNQEWVRAAVRPEPVSQTDTRT